MGQWVKMSCSHWRCKCQCRYLVFAVAYIGPIVDNTVRCLSSLRLFVVAVAAAIGL